MIRYWLIVCSIGVVPLSTVSSFAINSAAAAGIASGQHVATFGTDSSVSSFEAPDQKDHHDVSGKSSSSTANPVDRRLRRDVAAAGDNLETGRNVDDRREIENDEIKKLSVRLPPHADRFNMFPFDYHDNFYQREQSDALSMAVRRLEALVAANELRRVAASNGEKRGSWSALADAADRRQLYGGNLQREEMASGPGREFDYDVTGHEDGEKEERGVDWGSRQQRSFDSLGGGMLPIKRQFDSLGGGMLPIKRRSQSKFVAASVDEGGRSMAETSRDVERRNFDSLGGGLLPI